MSHTEFVRNEMLPELPAPPSSVGIIGWLRENLFSGLINTAFTLLSIFVIYYILEGVLSWTFLSVWNASSLTECREIANATWGSSHGHACWGVIRERWLQLLFGFYPPELYWRPLFALGWLALALAPILFPSKKTTSLFIFTAIYPFILPWLMWGGTIWLPILIMAGFLIGYGTYRLLGNALNMTLAMLGALITVIIWWTFCVSPLSGMLSSIFAGELKPVISRDFGGFMLSILIGIVAIGGSLPLGILLALGRQSDLPIIKIICIGFIEFIRGVPLITLLFVASTLLNIFLPPSTNFDIILRVIIMVTLFAAAYVAEVVRGGLAALPKGQYEGAYSMGLNYWQAQILIILPQALKISIPGIVSTFIGILKDTTLVSIIGLLDPMGLATAIRSNISWNGVYWELFVFIAALFFITCFSMSRYSMYLERRLETEHR